MTEEDVNAASPPAKAAERPRHAEDRLPEHQVRRALLDLLAEVGTVTATEAAGRLGYSSGLCSFHLRQLARYGHIEEVPRTGGRARPWRLRQTTPPPAAGSPAEGFGQLARGLEDESYQRWLDQRDQAPTEWRQDEAFSAVVHLTPEEMSAVAQAVHETLAPYQARERQSSPRPPSAQPVAVIARLFPLLLREDDEAG
ncbi:winged helix-turn-helix domain-containing protein [Streptomyces sp. Li-HN-5-11]|uniref:ArsR/SmtB family transcription factor n=1 Tax=Streptomyces sp. Li-HN-5-11 TaxID=3075432 RepID=UPI0028A988DB|nr:winged helix-turn-helix domain-containing protein [Streptomyces sp. Li-HN-5-11]WNM36084.1 winged helix-turn-helix domain-containing protein [Streptomyces sp. Li-HN-5-11]